VYEDTEGLRIGEPVIATGSPFVVELGPGLLGSIFDGIQRPLSALLEQQGAFIKRGSMGRPLDRIRKWDFEPGVRVGAKVSEGDALGRVHANPRLSYRILVPPGMHGWVEEMRSGRLGIEDRIAVLRTQDRNHEISMLQRWPARQARLHLGRLPATEPLITGQRVIDSFFPLAKGGTAVIPGGFGTGKTVLEQSFAKWINADVVIYVGCGERGNEMTEVLQEFPELEDPCTGGSLMDRTVLIANTSNMPVAAREASIYTGITIAEYFRDMGYDVALLADSTSRWGEALREVSARLEEMPGEEGYPAYLLSRLAEFYGRAGRVRTLGSQERIGSVSVIGAVSPPGGDFSEPVTQNSLRVTGVFWGLDTELARRRHFPAIDWSTSYSRYPIGTWFARSVAEDWEDFASRAQALLQREQELQEIVQLVGEDALTEFDKGELLTGRILREDFLQQSAFSSDSFCVPEKTYWMLKSILLFQESLMAALRQGKTLGQAADASLLDKLSQMREWKSGRYREQAAELAEQIRSLFQASHEISHREPAPFAKPQRVTES
ncbi:MAG: V-type ATP synthase subunit A, partial [Acidobacteria bacterium]|nr:V-type ATP synthase subunit A [Acidobacteriota bacterium]